MKWRIKVKKIELKLYKVVGYEQFGWHSDKERLKTRIRRYEMGKRLAEKSKMKKKRKEEYLKNLTRPQII